MVAPPGGTVASARLWLSVVPTLRPAISRISDPSSVVKGST
jgi:hypothetical protein